MNAEIDYESDVACFTLIWAIKNYGELPCFRLHSPWFSGKLLKNTTWSLSLVDEADTDIPSVACRIERDDDKEEIIDINFDLELIGADGTPLVKKSGEKSFEKFSKSEYLPLVTTIAILEQKGTFLPNDTLTVRCQMRQKNSATPGKDISFARTILGVEKRELFWANNEFSQMLPGQTRSLLVQPLQKGAPTIELILYLAPTSRGNNVVIEIKLSDRKEHHSVIATISVVDADGRIVHTKGEGTTFVFEQDCLKFEPFIKDIELLQHSSRYLPDDVLFLKCELKTSFGVVTNRLENSCNGLSTTVDSALPAKSTSDLKSGEESRSGLKNREESRSDLKSGEESRSGLKSREESRSGLKSGEETSDSGTSYITDNSSSSSEEVTLLNRHSNLKRKRRVLLVILDAITMAFF